MTKNVALSGSAGLVANFSISSTFQSLTSKINGAFGLFLAGVGSFCIYHAVRSYQYFMNPSSQLDDGLKVVKCKILLQEIKNQLKKDTNADVTALVIECAELHNSLVEKSADVSLDLFICYAKRDPDTAFNSALGLSSEKELFSACQIIHKANPEFDREKLSSLLNKAYEAHINQKGQISSFQKVKGLLEYVKLAHSIDTNSELKNTALKEAMDFATKCEDGLAQADAWCEIGKVCQDLGIDESVWKGSQFISFLDQAKQTSESAVIPDSDSYKAHLTLAKSQHLYGEDNNDALGKAFNLLYQGVHQDADLLASAYAEIGRADIAEQILTDTLKTHRNAKINDPNTYLRLANAFHKQVFQTHASVTLGYAFEAIKCLPESTDEEINSKVGLLEQVSRCEAMSEVLAQDVLESLVQLYNDCSFGDLTKKRITFSIFDFCKKNNLAQASQSFFEAYLSGLTKSNLSAFDKVNELAHFKTRSLTDEQRTRMIEAAEGFVSQAPSCNEVLANTIIAEAYLDVNPAKSRELLDNYAKSQAKGHLLQAVAMPIALTIFQAYPMVGLFCSAAIPLIAQLRVFRF